ncbi:glycosyltransferase family 2 protein [Patescibacteria group bacterium]|nr:glycosyltransferase family 2 protein [Patescibacteria group bacterium]
MNDTKITIVIINYNGLKYLPDCFDSLSQQTFLPIKVIVVDNNSIDGSRDYLKKWKTSKFKFEIILNKKNRGFAEANNQAMIEDLNSRDSSDYIFMLNQDTVMDKNCLLELSSQASFFSRKKIFAWQPLILCFSDKKLIQTSGDKIHFLGFGYSGDFKKPITEFLATKTSEFPSITYASGAGMFINTKALKQVGLLDKDLFMYHEDLDICLRARFLGYDILLNDKAIVYHKYTEEISNLRWYWSERNRQLTLLKFYKTSTLLLLYPLIWAMDTGVLFFSIFDGWGRLKIKSYFSCSLQIFKVLKKRKRIQGSRKINDKEFATLLESKFDFAGFEHPLIKYLVNPIFGFIWNILKKIIIW